MSHARWVLVFTLLTIVGCRVTVQVPPGGEVRTAFGTNDCAENTVCEIEVNDTNFNETFRAVPNEGYEFIGWRRDDLYFCGLFRGDCQLVT
ncbi:MAG: hypothetical protein AAGF35_06045, partial [Pseudomonadota bacterium]